MTEVFVDISEVLGDCMFAFEEGGRTCVKYFDPHLEREAIAHLSEDIHLSSWKDNDGNELPELIINLLFPRVSKHVRVQKGMSAFDVLCTTLSSLDNETIYVMTTQERDMVDAYLRAKIKMRKEIALNGDDKVYNLIAQADKCRKEIVLCLLGSPGIGKTEAVERYAKDHGRNVVHIIASQILPNEVSGITMPDRETHSMEIFDHYRLSHMKDGDILFFDELLQGQQQVLSACLTLIQERRLMSGKKLPDILIVAAANPLASPMQLRPEIRQRFMFVKVNWQYPKWIEYMKSKGFKGDKTLESLAKIVAGRMNNDKDWNTFTPRTATKLCEWMLATEGDKAVKQYIDDAFGKEVTDTIWAVVNNTISIDEKKRNFKEFKENVVDIIDGVVDPKRKEEAKRTVIKTIDENSEKESFDMSELMDILMGMPEWPAISVALEHVEM